LLHTCFYVAKLLFSPLQRVLELRLGCRSLLLELLLAGRCFSGLAPRSIEFELQLLVLA
jgi:hypothetical protein